ncbi:MAG: hydrogenase nickel incorporation protein HypB [Anaerolineae bacterium]|nr:hydrogenase nickel incorporation protein HypB [Anaerolineae bacterium]
MSSRLLEIHQGILDKNDRLAYELRHQFERAGVYVVNLVSSPGTGKTAFLERTLAMLVEQGCAAAALVGDLATENDARRLERSGAPVRQIVTAGICHLEANMIATHLDGWNLNNLDFLFIENVGNLVCPSSYYLGEALRVAMLSVTEGEDKPLKYPPMFNSADLAVITKLDLADAVEFKCEETYINLQAVRPGIRILETSAKTGDGMVTWIELLKRYKSDWQQSQLQENHRNGYR